MYPKSVEALIRSFLRIPGVGKKTAERYAYHIVNRFSDEETNEFIASLEGVRDNIKFCKRCGFLTEGDDICEFCKDESRDISTILVVEGAKDVVAIEKVQTYKGLYHVLGGSISPLNGVGPEDLTIDLLKKRVQEGNVKEVIVATSATVEGEATALYLGRVISDKNVKVSRIAYGMPVGSSLEYNDETTIFRAIEGRKEIK